MTDKFILTDCRPFNLEHARKGAPICTRNGRDVQILHWELRDTYPVVGYVAKQDKDILMSWSKDGFYNFSGHRDGSDNDLFMKPNGYVDGKPVHVGDELINGVNTQFEYRFTVGPDMIDRFLDCSWPVSEKAETEEPKTDTQTDRNDFLSMFSESTIREVVRKIRGRSGASIAVEVVISSVGETENHNIVQAVDTIKIKGGTQPPAETKDMTGWIVRRDAFSKMPDRDALVFIERRDGMRSKSPARADSFCWTFQDLQYDIVAYKVVR